MGEVEVREIWWTWTEMVGFWLAVGGAWELGNGETFLFCTKEAWGDKRLRGEAALRDGRDDKDDSATLHIIGGEGHRED